VDTKYNAARVALAALAAATVAMLTLHVVQRGLSPFEEPVSYYVHGEHGWLLDVALTCFGAAALAIALAGVGNGKDCAPSWSLIVFGAGMIVAGIIPSDRWFPWEDTPTASGLIHAAVSVFSPPLLLIPMFSDLRSNRHRRRRSTVLHIVAYSTGLLTSAVALAIGFTVDGPPPLIGLWERVLALSGVSWIATMAVTDAKS
jgi:hypothetical protein